jgi:hypothetical protein
MRSPLPKMCVGCGRAIHHGSRCRDCATEHERAHRGRRYDDQRSRGGLGVPIRERMASAETATGRLMPSPTWTLATRSSDDGRWTMRWSRSPVTGL